MASPLCIWSEIPRSECPHCTGDLSIFEIRTDTPSEEPALPRMRNILSLMRMEATRHRESQADVTLGPCPGCLSWQLDYTYEAASTYAAWEVPYVEEFGPTEPILFDPVVDMRPFHEVIEAALREHLDECPHLQRLVGDL